jgi:hypothetical protein
MLNDEDVEKFEKIMIRLDKLEKNKEKEKKQKINIDIQKSDIFKEISKKT